MDGTRFDSLTRMVASGGSRRRLLAGLGASALGLIRVGTADARRCTEAGTICREHATCCSGLCGTPDRQGRRRCACVDNTGASCTVIGSTEECCGTQCAGGVSTTLTCQDCNAPMTTAGAFCQATPGNQCCGGNPNCFVGVKVDGGALACFSTGICRSSLTPCTTDADCGGALICAQGSDNCGCTGATPTFCGTPCGAPT